MRVQKKAPRKMRATRGRSGCLHGSQSMELRIQTVRDGLQRRWVWWTAGRLAGALLRLERFYGDAEMIDTHLSSLHNIHTHRTQ